MAIPFVRNFDDFAEAIANPSPDRPIRNAVGGFGRALCDRASARPDIYTPTFLQFPIKLACKPYWENNNYSEPEAVAPFTGGQCPGTRYTLTGTYTVSCGPNAGTTRPWRSGGLAIGPVTGIVSSAQGWQVSHAGANIVEVVDTGVSQGVNRVPRQGVACSQVQNQNVTADTAPTIGTISPFGGDPDNCGDPPPVFEPGPNPAPDPGPQPPGTGPALDPRGQPIVILPPNITIAPDLNVDLPPGPFDFGGGTGTGAPLPPLGSDEQPGGGGGAGGGENDFGEPPEGERWVGCCVRITTVPTGTGNIPQAEPESIYPRTIGNVRLRFAGPDELSAYDTPVVNRQKTTCVWEPVRGLNPTGVRVNLLPGFGYVFTPYSVPLEQ